MSGVNDEDLLELVRTQRELVDFSRDQIKKNDRLFEGAEDAAGAIIAIKTILVRILAENALVDPTGLCAKLIDDPSAFDEKFSVKHPNAEVNKAFFSHGRSILEQARRITAPPSDAE